MRKDIGSQCNLNSKGEASEKEHVSNLLMVELLKAMEAASHDETISKAKKKFKAE